MEKLKDLLVAWRKECIDPETQGCKVTSAEAIASLQKIVNSGEEKNDKFVQEVLEML